MSMKRFRNFLIATLLLLLSMTVNAQDKSYENNYEEIMSRTEWFRQARFGMFIHWGAYSVPARGEWVKTREKMTTEQYQKHVDAFVPSNYKPVKWATIAKNAGMKYAVMTAKHHDGFCMFDSKLTEYKITNNMPGRDFVREYLEAFRGQGLKVGLYYSIIDWHHKDYPNVGNHPMRGISEWDKKQYNWDNYLDYMHKQIEELMTQYGKIDVLWLDYSFDDYENEKWKAKELVEMIRKHQPDIILNNRLVANHGISSVARDFKGYGDFSTPEQGVPDKGLVDTYGNPIPWETCLTLNNSWGYNSTDTHWKSAELIIHTLVNCVSKNGNLLLNIGPDSQGTIPQQSVKTLNEVGNWMAVNGESVYGCKKSDLPKPDWGYFTQADNVIYAHLTNPIIGPLNIRNYADKVDKIIVLPTQKEASTAVKWFGNKEEENFFINIKEPIHKTYLLPDNRNTVFKIILKD